MDPAHRERYFGLSKTDQVREWCFYKTSVVIPVSADLSTRLFDALACGQLPIVSDVVMDLDRVISPDIQRSLPILKFRAGDFQSLRTMHAEAIRRFDEGGARAARGRHRYAMENHTLENRVASIVTTITSLSGLRAVAVT